MALTTAQIDRILQRLIGNSLSNGEYLLAVERIGDALNKGLITKEDHAEMLARISVLLKA